MGRLLGTWLSGPQSAFPPRPTDDYPGKRLGLPAQGSGSLAPVGRRLGAYLIDAFGASLIAALFVRDAYAAGRGWLTLGIFAAAYVVLLTAGGQTAGMRLLGLRVVPLGGARPFPDLLRSALRTLLLCLLVPALLTDRDGRGLHDRAAGTAVVLA